MDIITKTGEIWSENAIGAVISIIKESDDSIESERKLTHWLEEMNCPLIAMALARIDTELYQIYKVQGWRVARHTPPLYLVNLIQLSVNTRQGHSYKRTVHFFEPMS